MMNEAAALTRGNAIVLSSESPAGDRTIRAVRTDGRNRRAAETRRRILAAAKEMISETSTAPTVVAVAKRADVSVRSVFQHFGDVESLFVTTVDSIGQDLVIPPPTAQDLSLPFRIAMAVDNLAQLFDKIVPLRVAAGQFAHHPALIERSNGLRQEVRRRVADLFAEEFAALSPQAQEELADAIAGALSLEAWVVLRRRDGLSYDRATAAWRRTLTALVTHRDDVAAAA
ncbi:MAG: TetR/AcrR family transcriptional regulator [Reyranellaceae bacterium]|uniref:TetR/AcrR family transcriptional regulator n=1 Tax=Reyranella sp. TaxID=1929291 RepID=UPI00378342B9